MVTQMMRRGWAGVESQIVIESDYVELLDGLEGFSHIIVLFWLHLSGSGFPARVHPRGRSDLPLTGVFATRAPHRPNLIGLAIVPLLELHGNSLRIRGLDAVNGTPVLDIKPYLPKDVIPEAVFPEWVSRADSA